MAITTSAELVGAVCASHLLDGPQQDVLVRQLQRQCPDLPSLLRAMVERGWLTPFQAKQLGHGHGDSLTVGPYVLLDLLGEGGMGRVFKARQKKLGRIVALKVIRKEWLTRPDAVSRFQREVRSAAKLAHPNIVLALDAALSGDTYYIAMEYVEGIDLQKLVNQSGPLPVGQACNIAYQAALGLQHAHERGLVHRDIKPSNLLITQAHGLQPVGGAVKILDMGLARVKHVAESDGTNTVTQAGVVVGTPDFISPEQARDSRTVDIRSDIYSLGCTLYFMLAGRAPFPGGTGMEKIFKHQLEAPKPIAELRPHLPGALVQVVEQLMAKKPDDRPQTPAAVARALRPFLPADLQAAEAITARKPPRAGPRLVARVGQVIVAPLQLRRRFPGSRWLTFALAAGLLLTLCVAGAAWVGGFRPGAWLHSPSSAARGPLAQLDAANIAATERVANLPPEVVAVLGEHRFRHWGMVLGAAFSPDGKSLATVGTDRQVRIWDVATGVQRRAVPIDGAIAMPTGTAFSPDAQTLAVLTPLTSIKVFDSATGKLLRAFPNPRMDGQPLALAPDGQCAVFLGSGGAVKLVDLVSGQERGVLTGAGAGHTFVFAQDGKTLVGASRPGAPQTGELRIWDTATARQRRRVVLSKPGVNAVAVAADGHAVAVLTAFTTLEVFDSATGAALFQRQLPVNSTHLAFAPGGKTLAISAADRLRLHDLATGKEKDIAAGTGATMPQAMSMTFTADGQTLAVVGSMEARVRLWNVSSAQEIAPSAGGFSFGGALAISRDGGTLASSFGFGKSGIQLWDPVHARVRARVGEPAPGTTLLALAPDGRTAIVRSPTALSLWDTAAGTQKASVAIGTPMSVWFAAASPGGRTIFTFNQQTGKLWDGATLQLRTTVEGIKAPQPNTIVFSADGTRMALADYQGNGSRVRLWDTGTGKETPLQLPIVKAGLLSLALSPDARLVAVSGIDGTIKLWDAATGHERLSVQQPAAARPLPFNLQFAPGGATLVGWNGLAVKLWDTATARERPMSKEVREGISAVAFTGDGRTLAVADGRGRITLWNVDASHEAGHVQLPGPVSHLTFAADGRHLATSNANGTIYILRLPPS